MPRVAYNLNEKVAKAFQVEAEKVAKQIADFIGRPTDAQEVSLEDEIAMWNMEGISAEEASQLFAAGMPIDQVVDKRFPKRRFMMQYQRPDPKQQIHYAERMKKLTEEKGIPSSTVPKVTNESAGEVQSEVGDY